MQRRTKLAIIASVAAAVGTGAAIAGHHKGDGKHGPRAERMIERLDADNDGKVTLEEMKATARERFARRDVDGDGVVTREDREARRANRRAERFAEIDADKDGVISQEEFVAFKPKRGERSGRRGMRGKHGGRHGHRGYREGHSAPLTIQEVEAQAERRFSRLDQDEKGYITLEDIQASGGKRGKRRGRH